MNRIPAMPTVTGKLAHEEQGMWLAWEVLTLVHKPLGRDEIYQNLQAKAALMEEATQMRRLEVWDESQAVEVDQLLQSCEETGQSIHIAETMPICHVKNAELPPEKQKLKGRLVFRGDNCRDEKGIKAIYREAKSLPATVHSINLVLYFGMLVGHVVTISDATKAYLQAPLKSKVPTWVILPRIIWTEEWKRKFTKVACPLHRAMYGHTTAGDDWHDYFDGILVNGLKGERVPEFPSLWYFPQWHVLVASYVDDVIAAGPQEGVNRFWNEVKKSIQFDEVTNPGRYLGRDHMIYKDDKGRYVHFSMIDYALSAVEMYEKDYGPLKSCETPFVSDAMLQPEGYQAQGQLAGSAAALLMKVLWLARLSRPDLSFAVVSLAGAISKRSRNHDLQLKRLLGYLKSTTHLGLEGFVPSTQVPPALKVYCDADLAGDPLTCKSHTGIFVCLTNDDGLMFPLTWCSKRQTAVARSTTEAELAAANEAVFHEALPIQVLLEKVMRSSISTTLLEDNSSCIQIIRAGYSPKLRSMSKTHRISVAALAEAVEENLIEVSHIDTKAPLADIFTKALNRMIFLGLRERIGVCPVPQVKSRD